MKVTGRLPAWLPAANRVVRALARLGVPLSAIHVLTVPGRTSGRPRPTPVVPLTVAGHRYVVAGIPQADWARNARAAGHGTLRTRGVTRAVLLTEVLDPEVKRAVLHAFPTEVPGGVAFFQQLGLVERGDPDEFAAVADQVAVFEVAER
jgi:hypothetical protein